MAKSDIYVANETFSAEVDGTPVVVHKGQTRVRAGHPLLDGREALFDRVEDEVQYDVEQATAAPGERRGGRIFGRSAPDAEPEPTVETEGGDSERKVYSPEELADLRRADLEQIATERGVLPEAGSGANGGVVIQDLIDAILTDQE